MVNGHGHAASGQRLREGPAQPAAGARHEGDAVPELH